MKILLGFLLFLNIYAQDVTALGGDLSQNLFDPVTGLGVATVQVPAPNVSGDRKQSQLDGFGAFHGTFSKEMGLGTDFVNSSCGACHLGNGKGVVKFNSTSDGSSMIVKVSLRGLNPDGSPREVPGIGEQLADHNTDAASNTKISLAWSYISGRYPDKTRYKLRKPKLTFKVNGVNTSSSLVASSLRMTPSVIGVGLLENISDASIIAMSDPLDIDKDGIKGHPNIVPNKRTGGTSVGRFGFKSSHPTVEQQSAAAFVFDMGVTNFLFKSANQTYELPDDQLNKITLYQKLAGVPYARRQTDPSVIKGKQLFQTIGCNKCHKMTIVTDNNPEDPELSNQVIHPFTDLLLHNMGTGLADLRSEFHASGAHWRTTPLWGIGYNIFLSKNKHSFLHDGRATSIEEAILWHGGEAEAVKKKFMRLNKLSRQALIKFVNSL